MPDTRLQQISPSVHVSIVPQCNAAHLHTTLRSRAISSTSAEYQKDRLTWKETEAPSHDMPICYIELSIGQSTPADP
jgi:hypothetical protein